MRTISINEYLYLGQTSGKIMKQTHIPALLKPRDFTFQSLDYILMALKSAVLKKDNVFNPLISIKEQLKSKKSVTFDPDFILQ